MYGSVSICSPFPTIDVIIGFSPTDYTVVESIGQALLTVTIIEGVLTGAVAFSVSTSDGSAKGS